MVEDRLPRGLVLWPVAAGIRQRIGVLISDIHCTDCTVGDQTADENDWEDFFTGVGEKLEVSIDASTEVLLILNGDVVDLLRSGKWAAANVYPWQRNDPRFREIVLAIMRDIVDRHAHDPAIKNDSSGFFHYLQKTVRKLKGRTPHVTLVPVAGNHDKELQVVAEAREIYYRQCLGLSADDLTADYRAWVARQLASDPGAPWPLLPFYVADPSLRLFATHGQWRDRANSRETGRWKFRHGWQPQRWQQEQYRAFSDPCLGDTIASGLLSHFIWNATRAIEREVVPRARNRSGGDGIEHIRNVLREMDLYRPTTRAVVRLLEEAEKLDRRDEDNRLLYQTLVDQYRDSLRSWLSHPETFAFASFGYKLLIYAISLLSRAHWMWLDTALMRLMAWASGFRRDTPYAELPAFRADYRPLGFHLHAEGHTHVTMEVDLRFSPPPSERGNYTYVNLGAWRNRIVQKFGSGGYRRRSIGRALIVQGSVNSAPEGFYGFTLRDTTSWGDGLDRW